MLINKNWLLLLLLLFIDIIIITTTTLIQGVWNFVTWNHFLGQTTSQMFCDYNTGICNVISHDKSLIFPKYMRIASVPVLCNSSMSCFPGMSFRWFWMSLKSHQILHIVAGFISGALSKLRRVTISFVTSLHLSVCPH